MGEIELLPAEVWAELDDLIGNRRAADQHEVRSWCQWDVVNRMLARRLLDLEADLRHTRARLVEEEAAVEREIRYRDEYFEFADRLADAIAQATGEDIGEHSSTNDPFINALESAARLQADLRVQPLDD
jgi:hypothetical protein